NGFSKSDTHAATLASVTAYRKAMAGFAAMGTMDVWYAHLDEDQLLKSLRTAAKASGKQAKTAKRAEKKAEKALAKAHTRDSPPALSQLGELGGGRYRIARAAAS